ncbi:MAG: tripartite tricarboxylate transporter substrate-binding protein [Pseudomonadota bacterium]
MRFTGSPVETHALADAGKVTILGMTGDERSPAFPDVPMLKESGMDWSLNNRFSLCVPSRRPDDVKATIDSAAGRPRLRRRASGALPA